MAKRTLLVVLGAACLVGAVPPTPVVQTDHGRLAGVHQDGAVAFLGIPFAAPPVGELRWRAPQPAKAWAGIRSAAEFGNSCFQAINPRGFLAWSHEFVASNKASEDCLTLNVWTQDTKPAKPRAVLVWIYGGGFSQGSSQVAVYDGRHLASKGIVVVSVNYRVGALGFMAHPELSREAGTSGNYGLLDVIQSLKWVQANISQFGGDPSKVTIAGQSAGAALVHDLIGSPLAKGLFRGAIAESGSGLNISMLPREAAEKNGVDLMRAAGVSSIAELRALGPEAIDKAASAGASPGRGIRFAPIIDGVVLPRSLDDAMASRAINDTPILTGLTANESSTGATYGKLDAAALKADVSTRYGALADALLANYDFGSAAAVVSSQKELLRDQGLAATTLWGHRRLGVSQHPLYVYLFDHPLPGPQSSQYEAFHSAEIPYVFGTLDKAPERNITDVDRRLSELVMSYWINFVNTGDPNGQGLPEWPAFSLQDRQLLQLGPEPKVRASLPEGKLKIFEAFTASGHPLSIL